MSTGEERPSALALASSAGLTLAGVRSLAVRGRSDYRKKEEAEEWLCKGLEIEEKVRHADVTDREDRLAEAFQCFEKGIQLDPYHPELQFQLGTAYHLGMGTQEDVARGFSWLRKAAEQGHADAQYELCDFCDEVFGVPQQNVIQAAAWCRKAAEQGHNMAQFHMCNLYLSGNGVSQDKVEAGFWHELFISNWNEKAAMKSRDDFPAKLSSDELAHVQQRVAEWISAHELNSTG